MPVMGEMQLMATDTPSPTMKVAEPLSVSVVESEDDIDRWIDLVASDSEPEEYPFWQKVAQLEAHSRYTQLSLATWEGVLVGTCSLAKVENWGRIDSVFTHPHFRRKGVGSALVQSAVQASITQGNRITYLFTERGGEGAKLYEHLGFRTLARNPFRRHLG